MNDSAMKGGYIVQNQAEYPNGIAMGEAMKLASTPEGKELLKQLQEQNGPQVQSAIAQAQSGNYEQLKNTLATLMDTPAGKALLAQLRGQNHG